TSWAANRTDTSPADKRATYEEHLKQREAHKTEIEAELKKIEDEVIKKMPAEDQRAAEGLDRPKVLEKLPQYFSSTQEKEYLKLKRELATLMDKPDPGRELALSVNKCLVKPPATHVLLRGSPHSPGAQVEPAFPAVLGVPAPKLPAPEKDAKTSGRRTVLANWVASKDNPLPARVLVNRLWQHHFGRGIVATTNDFGKFGTGATHPELLDWLAADFVEGGWNI